LFLKKRYDDFEMVMVYFTVHAGVQYRANVTLSRNYTFRNIQRIKHFHPLRFSCRYGMYGWL